MSVQQTKLKAIADAIREKEGSTALIPASEFPARILALETGGVPQGTHTIILHPNDEVRGTVHGGGLASEGMTVTVKAKPQGSYKFSAWQENGADVSKKEDYAFTVNKDRELTAVFEEFIFEWTSTSLPSTGNWCILAYGNGKFLAVDTSNYTVAQSTDGIIWEKVTVTVLPLVYVSAIIYVDEWFIAISSGGVNSVCRSSDGIAWEEISRSIGFYDIAYGNGLFVGVGYNKSAHSTDGAEWTESAIPGDNVFWRSIAYGGNKFVTLPDGSDKFAYSSNGASWSTGSLPRSASWKSITYGDGKFVAVADDGGKIIYSNDGVEWLEAGASSAGAWYSVAYGDGVFVAVSSDKSGKSAYSLDGVNWTVADLPSPSHWRQVAYGGGKFVAIEAFNAANDYGCMAAYVAN